ncbi:MAG: patatin-like phospholipase family protein [Candidatus Saccharibacteria bacterium]
MPTDRPKIGIALSGASGRAIAHIGVLEVLKENNIPVDVVVGCSSGALIAVSYATDTMEELKQYLRKLTIGKLLSLWSSKDARGGLFHLHNATEELEKFTKGKKLEDVYPRIGFVAADINTGELVTLTQGDMIEAFKATVAVPGLLEPAVMGNKVLVDGGLVNIVPTKAARDMGADLVIGVNIAATKFIYEKRLPIWRGYRFLTKILGLQFIRDKILTKLASRILFQFDSQSDFLEEDMVKMPGTIGVLVRALDRSMEISDQWEESEISCDLMLEPRVKHFGKVDFAKMEKIYLEGRRAAEAALPEIRRLIGNFGKGKVGQPATKLKLS